MSILLLACLFERSDLYAVAFSEGIEICYAQMLNVIYCPLSTVSWQNKALDFSNSVKEYARERY